MNPTKDFYGYVKLTGEGVAGGKINLGVASDLLKGIDKNLRFFIQNENPAWQDKKFQLEVKIEPGSFWVYITGLAVTTIVTAYVSKAAQKLAENDVDEKSTSDVVKLAVGKMKSTAQIAKHLGGIDRKQVQGTKFKDGNQVIGIPNSKGQYLYIRKDEFDAFFAAPKNIYEPMAKAVNADTTLSIGVAQEDGTTSEETINEESKIFFTEDSTGEEISDLVLPELTDGEFVELEGELTRGNARTNTFGFAYKGHVLTCTLRSGNVRDFRQALFGSVRITGEITRHYQSTVSDDEKKRPKIIFDTIVTTETGSDQTSLL